jgi:hypothetical protein
MLQFQYPLEAQEQQFGLKVLAVRALPEQTEELAG